MAEAELGKVEEAEGGGRGTREEEEVEEGGGGLSHQHSSLLTNR